MTLMVNGEKVDDQLIKDEAESMRPHYDAMIQGMDSVEKENQLQSWARENVIERVLMRQAAVSDPEPLPAEEIERALEEMQKQPGADADAGAAADKDALKRDIETRLKLERLIASITDKVTQPKFKQVAEYYKKNRKQYETPELVRAAHIVKNINENVTEQEAHAAIQKVQEELKAGCSFEEIADRHSDCPGSGGDLGYFPPGEMVQEFEDVAFSLDINAVSQIFRTPFGYHIAKVHDRKPASVRKLSEVEDQVRQELHRQRQQRALEDYVDVLKAKAQIQDV